MPIRESPQEKYALRAASMAFSDSVTGVGREAHLHAGHQVAQELHGFAVGQVHVVAHGHVVAQGMHHAGGMLAVAIAQADEAGRLVEGNEVLHPVAVLLRAQLGIIQEPLHAVGIRPRALMLQRQGVIPMEQRHEGTDALLQHAVDEPVVEVNTLLVHLALTLGQQTRPGDGEAETS